MTREYIYRGLVLARKPDTIAQLARWEKTVIANSPEEAMKKLVNEFKADAKFDGIVRVYKKYLQEGSYVATI